jgi:YegS/Rv2252/BmrU family lipid kinase
MPQAHRDAARAVPVIVNTTSGTGHSPEDLDRLAAAFREAGLEARILEGRGKQLADVAREAVKEGPPVVVAAGGDGTMSAVAEAVRGTETAMGVLPMGTLNHFAKDLGIPLDARDAIGVIAAGRRVAVDIGEVNGVAFINNSSLGLYTDIVRHRRRRRRLQHSRRAAMIWAVLAAMRRAPLLHLLLRVEDRDHDCRGPFVFVGNNQYEMQGFNIGTRSRLDEGVLSIYTTSRDSFGSLVMLALRALFGRLRQADDFSQLRARELRVESRREQIVVALDGELRVMQTPLQYVVLPRALQVIVPQPAAGA